MIENILIMDTETTGLDPSKGATVIEVGAILFNVKYKQPIQFYSTLFPCDENPVENINRIPACITKANYSLNLSDGMFISMADSAYAIVAHHAKFDKQFVKLLGCGNYLLNKKWICTKDNFVWPIPLQRFRLEDICFALKIPYVNAHRALSDCFLLAQCFQNVPDLQERFSRIM